MRKHLDHSRSIEAQTGRADGLLVAVDGVLHGLHTADDLGARRGEVRGTLGEPRKAPRARQ